jgi:integrase
LFAVVASTVSGGGAGLDRGNWTRDRAQMIVAFRKLRELPTDLFRRNPDGLLAVLRASELRGLRWRDVDLKVGELHVRQRADRFGTIGVPKSKAGSHTVPLAPELVSALKAWKLACPISEAGLVFPSSTGKVEHHVTMLHGVETVMRAAGVVDRDGEPKYALHGFRHFFASWCINPKERGGRELPPKVVQHLLGHSSIVMTLDTYSHLFPHGDDRTELAEASSALLA